MRFLVSWIPTVGLAMVVGLAALATLGCAEGGGGEATPGVDVAGSGSPSANPTSSSGGGETIKVVMTDNVYAPKDIKLKAGQSYTIEVENKGLAIHDMHVFSKVAGEAKDFTSAITVAAGDKNTFEVKFTKKGSVKFQCDYHLPDMAGTITVE